MSRIGKKPIQIPQGVEVKIDAQKVAVRGPRGELVQVFPEEILLKKEDEKILVSPKRKTKTSSALWGLTRMLLYNNIKGVTDGFEKKLEIRGVGYRASLQAPLDSAHLPGQGDKVLKLEAGFSHSVEIDIPEALKISIEKNIITVAGIDKQKVGEFAAKIRRVRPPEPYKGKGIRYLGEKVRMKEGKKAGGSTG